MPKFNLQDRYLIAMVFLRNTDGTNKVLKYRHNIKDRTDYITKFCKDMDRKWPNVWYINFYYKDSAVFKERVYLKTLDEVKAL